MTSEWKKIDSLYFESDASLLRRVGRESISNQIVAIVELIKNSYDADAEDVLIKFENIKHGRGSIVVSDNGDGMTLEELKEKWMYLSVPDKQRNPVTKRKKRIKIGEKGIGRLGLEGLSEKVKIISKPRGHDKMFRLEINWENYVPGTPLNKIANNCYESSKNKNDSGFEIIIEDLVDKWDEERIKILKEQVSVITPLGLDLDFEVKVESKDYPEYEGDVESSFLKKHIFHFKSFYDGKSKAKYQMKKRMGKTFSIPEKSLRYTCGPIEFEFYFFYRDSGRYSDENIDITKIKDMLDSFGGVKLYRDGFLVKLQTEDWIGLDKMRVQDPSMIPGTNQIFGFVKITKNLNPFIRDTTNREGLIENRAYYDLKEFLIKSINNFRLFRKQAEYYEGTKTKKPIEKAVKKKTTKKKKKREEREEKESFLDFGRFYPAVFYKQLEDEINQCVTHNLPNAALVLCRKMVENLVYNLLYYKFPSDLELRFFKKERRPHNFRRLLDNLKEKLKNGEFNGEQEKMIEKFFVLLTPFLRDANSKTHSIIEYLDDVSQLEQLKIQDIIQLLVDVIHNVRNS